MNEPRILSPRYKRILLGFLFVTFFLEQGTRQIYNAVLPQIKVDFAQLGIFCLLGALVLLPAIVRHFNRDHIPQA